MSHLCDGTGWSVNAMPSNPAASAARANRVRFSPVTNSGLYGWVMSGIGGPVLHEMGSDRWPCHDRGTAGAADTDPPESERYMHEEPTASGPLSWLRVVDFTDERGALCARILADLGADVVRIAGPETPDSFAQRYRNANKRGVDLDLGAPRDRARLVELVGDADVLVENLRPEVRDAARSRPRTRSPPCTRVSCT